MTPSQSVILATIGDRVITVEEFRRNYEGGFSHLKTGQNRKLTYLNYLINEKLLALEGYRLGLNESPPVKSLEQKLLNELLIETLIDREVKSKIKVTPEEIQEEITKSKVRFKFRYWVEPTRERAQQVALDMRERGYAEVVDDLMHRTRETRIDPKRFETDYLTHLDVPPEVLAAIQDLPYGEISDPVELNGKYYIFQVLDIRRQGITENEYKANMSRFEQIIFYRKLKEKLGIYIEDLLEPRNIVTKGESFKLLADALSEWSRSAERGKKHFLESVKQASEESPALMNLKKNLNQTFLTHSEGQVSIGEFLKHFNVNRFFRGKGKEGISTEDLHHEVQLSIRDYFMAQEASSLNLQNSPEVQWELQLWRDKWVFNEMREILFSEEGLIEQDREKNANEQLDSLVQQSAGDWNRQIAILNSQLQSLREKYPVSINEAVLDTLKVIEFKKSRWASMQIFKAGTNRPAFPVVDPIWNKPNP
ncbi:MAG: hypothetical protein Kow0042_07880 [Calditrichia bacterium]